MLVSDRYLVYPFLKQENADKRRGVSRGMQYVCVCRERGEVGRGGGQTIAIKMKRKLISV